VRLGVAAGGFGPPAEHVLGEVAAIAEASEILAEDLDGDGDLDIAAALQNLSQVQVFLGKAGSFVPAKTFPATLLPTSAAAGDIDGDGHLDLSATGLGYDGIVVLRNTLVEPVSLDRDSSGVPDECERPRFHRGDPNANGDMDLSDGVFAFAYLFLGGPTPGCLEAADTQNDGGIDLSDSIAILNHLFLGGPPPASPGPPSEPCGEDPSSPGSPSDLGCGAYPAC